MRRWFTLLDVGRFAKQEGLPTDIWSEQNFWRQLWSGNLPAVDEILGWRAAGILRDLGKETLRSHPAPNNFDIEKWKRSTLNEISKLHSIQEISEFRIERGEEIAELALHFPRQVDEVERSLRAAEGQKPSAPRLPPVDDAPDTEPLRLFGRDWRLSVVDYLGGAVDLPVSNDWEGLYQTLAGLTLADLPVSTGAPDTIRGKYDGYAIRPKILGLKRRSLAITKRGLQLWCRQEGLPEPGFLTSSSRERGRPTRRPQIREIAVELFNDAKKPPGLPWKEVARRINVVLSDRYQAFANIQTIKRALGEE